MLSAMMATGKSGARRILVTGATGRQGGAVARQLLARHFEVTVLTRNPENPAARALADQGALVTRGDFDDPSSLERALGGISGVFAMQTPYEAGIEREVAHGMLLAQAARRACVTQIVYSSVAGADLATGVPHFESKGRIEQHIAAQKFPHATILRPTFFMEMFLAPGNLRTLANGRIALGLSENTKIAMIAVDDIAAMAVAAFEDPERWNGAAITLAGDEPNLTQVAAAFSKALGRRIDYAQISYEEIEADTRPKAGTQRWLEDVGWKVDLAALRENYPFGARTIGQWAEENLGKNVLF